MSATLARVNRALTRSEIPLELERKGGDILNLAA